MIVNGQKWCPSCKVMVNVDKFNKDSRRVDKLNTYCKICQGKHDSEYAKTPKGKKTKQKSNYKRRSTPRGKLDNKLLFFLWSIFKNKNHKPRGENQTILILFNYTILELRNHIESTFKPGMTWENHGTVWELDHIIKRKDFDYEKYTDKECIRCWAKENLRAMFSSENHSNN